MGCQQSKGATAVTTTALTTTTTAKSKQRSSKKSSATSPGSLQTKSLSKDSSLLTLQNEPSQQQQPASHHQRPFLSVRSIDRLYKLMRKAQSNDFLDELAILAVITPEAVLYRHPQTGDTPLHVAAQLISREMIERDALTSVVKAMISAQPEALRSVDNYGNLPLHYAIAPPSPLSGADDAYEHGGGTGTLDAWRSRTTIVRMLLHFDRSTTSVAYLKRNNVTFDAVSSSSSSSCACGCSPLYRVVQMLPDDPTTQKNPPPTLEYVAVLLKAVSTTGRGTPIVNYGNASDGDKPLALLYRRFTRQFDLAEKFFAGDNSRPSVVEHRHRYKSAAGNTWKIIELLLKEQEHAGNTLYRTIHRAVQGETPPDLLRYIVETNAHDLTVADEMGNLPLHYAAKFKPPLLVLAKQKQLDASSMKSNNNNIKSNNSIVASEADNRHTSFPAFYSKYVIDELLYKYPEAAAQPDANGNYPLTLAVLSGKHWIGGGIKSLYDSFPEALQQIDLSDYPLLQRSLSMEVFDDHEKDFGDLVDEKKSDNDDVIPDEQHDAIMLVQQPNVDITEVAISMWAHEEDAGVQMLGCVAISRLLRSDNDGDAQNSGGVGGEEDVRRRRRIALVAVPAVVNAMKAHPNEVIVQEKACQALAAMASADNHREVSFVATGAVAAIVGAMQAHVSDYTVQQESCGALAQILEFGGSDRATVVASVSGVTALINAMAAHREVAAVQMGACRALVALTQYDNANLPELPRSQMEPLLLAARDVFPDQCGPAVQVLLRRLS